LTLAQWTGYLQRKQLSLGHEILGTDSVRLLVMAEDRLFPDMDLWEQVWVRKERQWQPVTPLVVRPHIPQHNLKTLFGAPEGDHSTGLLKDFSGL
jgi:hypothetical protein